jgi:outer membrane immunogenic protein
VGLNAGGTWSNDNEINNSVTSSFCADVHGDSNITNSASTGPVLPTTATVTGAASQKIDFIGTLRGRLGWTPTAPLLFYMTGGLAYGHTRTDVSFTSHFTSCNTCTDDPFTSASTDEWRAGWTAGGGVEWMFGPHWSLKGEYLYYDLGNVSLDNLLDQRSVGRPFVTVGIRSEAHYKGNIARVGVNYHF